MISQSDQLGYKINRHDKTFNPSGAQKVVVMKGMV